MSIEATTDEEAMAPYGARITALAEQLGDTSVLTFVRQDGSHQQLSWRELDDRSTQIARNLARRGLGIGGRLGIRLRNSPEHVLVAFAGWKLGAVVVPMRWDLPDWELERVHDVLAPDAVVGPDDECLTASEDESTEPLEVVTPPHASGILSSGSTGTPKVILRTIPGIYFPGASSNQLVNAYQELSQPQLLLVPAPLYHNNGFMALNNLLGGDRLLLMERFDAGLLLDAIERFGVTGFVATSIMLQRLAREPRFETADLSSLEWVMHGAAPLPEWLARKWIDRVGPEHFFVCYGSSEGAGATFARGDEYLEHPGTVGRGAMNTELKILDEDEQELPVGEIGYVYMKAAFGVLSEYLGDIPPIPISQDGYATVGDIGRVDEDGYLYLHDRRVDMIVTGGANVYPAEVENALSEHPSVADVVVLGLTDPEWGRRVHAIVQRHDDDDSVTAEDLKAFAKERLTAYKVPKTIEFVDEIPRSEATKVNRAALVAEREEASDGS